MMMKMESYRGTDELIVAGQSFLATLFGAAEYFRWCSLKRSLGFESEVMFVKWLMDTIDQTKHLLREKPFTPILHNGKSFNGKIYGERNRESMSEEKRRSDSFASRHVPPVAQPQNKAFSPTTDGNRMISEQLFSGAIVGMANVAAPSPGNDGVMTDAGRPPDPSSTGTTGTSSPTTSTTATATAAASSPVNNMGAAVFPTNEEVGEAADADQAMVDGSCSDGDRERPTSTSGVPSPADGSEGDNGGTAASGNSCNGLIGGTGRVALPSPIASLNAHSPASLTEMVKRDELMYENNNEGFVEMDLAALRRCSTNSQPSSQSGDDRGDRSGDGGSLFGLKKLGLSQIDSIAEGLAASQDVLSLAALTAVAATAGGGSADAMMVDNGNSSGSGGGALAGVGGSKLESLDSLSPCTAGAGSQRQGRGRPRGSGNAAYTFPYALVDEMATGLLRCRMCGYATRQSSAMRRHICQHTGERPEKCPFCAYSTIQRVCLRKHMENHHTAPGQFKCGECSFVGNSQINLWHHLLAFRHQV